MHDDGQQSLLLAQALPMALHRLDPKNLQSYLNWFVYLFRVRQAEEKWPKRKGGSHMLMSETSSAV